jgi:hypothetical protein
MWIAVPEPVEAPAMLNARAALTVRQELAVPRN